MCCVVSCRCVLVSVVHPVVILSAVFCVICSLLMFVSDASGDHMVETYLSKGLVMFFYMTIIGSFCFLHIADGSALSICIVCELLLVYCISALFYILYLLHVILGSRVSILSSS